MPDEYDLYLAAVLAVMVLGALSTTHPAIAAYEGMAGASLLATIILFEMIFRNPPAEPTSKVGVTVFIVGIGWGITVLTFL